MSTHATRTQPAFHETAAAPEKDAVARPKVMRRPSQFSATQATAAAPEIQPQRSSAKPQESNEDERLPILAPPVAPVSLAARPCWQDDLRFGIFMVSVVVAVNILLMLGLPKIRHAPAITATQESTLAPLTPGGLNSPTTEQAITIYTSPAPAAPIPDAPVHTLGTAASTEQ